MGMMNINRTFIAPAVPTSPRKTGAIIVMVNFTPRTTLRLVLAFGGKFFRPKLKNDTRT